MFYENGTKIDKLHQLMSWTWEVDSECSLGDAVTVERCVRDVIKRPKEGRTTPGGRLRIACIQSGLTQKVFADKIGISRSSLTTLMTNRSPVSRPVALAVELVHRFNAEWILTGGGLIHGRNLASGSWRQHGQ